MILKDVLQVLSCDTEINLYKRKSRGRLLPVEESSFCYPESESFFKFGEYEVVKIASDSQDVMNIFVSSPLKDEEECETADIFLLDDDDDGENDIEDEDNEDVEDIEEESQEELVVRIVRREISNILFRTAQDLDEET